MTTHFLAEPEADEKLKLHGSVASQDALCAASAGPEEIVLRPRQGWIAIDWRELLRFRDLLYFLVWRDIKVRYKQTVLGVAWAVIQPLMSMVVFTLIFGRFAKLPSDGIPYAVFVYAGLLPWLFFATSLTQGGQSLISQQNLLTKIYFPRLFVPAAVVGAAAVDMCISFGVYMLILICYRFVPSPGIIVVPLLMLLTSVVALGVAFLLSALTVTFRDFRYVLPFLVQIWMYVSPVVYSVSLVPPRYRLLMALNPLTGIISAYRSAILGLPWDLQSLGISSVMAFVLFFWGIYYFRRTERRFADIA